MAEIFVDQVVVVTGAASGIGAAVAAEFGVQGATVASIDVTVSNTKNAWKLDVSDPNAAEVVIAEIEQELGPITCLVNVAGVLATGPVVEASVNDWEKVFSVNALGVFIMSQVVVRRMIPRRSGSIITVSSNAAHMPRANMAAYAASKAAATQFTKSLALELAQYGIRCNIVSPGSTATSMQWSLWHGPDAEAKVIAGDAGVFKPGIPLSRIATPEDVAQSVIFLASSNAQHLTMQDIVVDGGATLGT